MIFHLGGGKEVVVSNERLTVWANRGGVGVDLTPEQQEAIGLAMFRAGRKRRRRA
jgi:hypothetical protein